MYAQNNSTKLSKPLGPWNQRYNLDYNWTWMVNPQTHQLYHQYQQVWHTYQPERRKLMEIIYPMQLRIIREAPANTVPATPHLICSRIHLALPIPTTPNHPEKPATIHQTVLQKLTTPPGNWEGPLWNHIQPMANIGQLKLCIAQRKTIMLVSDASVSPNGKGSCAWTIWSQTHLWQGSGHVPRPNLDMYSGLAEAYGMYSVLSFLQRYLATFPLVLPTEYGVQVHCDNKGLVDRLNRKATHQYPRDSIMDDYPIIGEIQHKIKELHPIAVTISHVKGHQDKAKLERPLTIPKTLNIDCDKRASEAMTNYPDTTPTDHPKTDIGYPHLLINGAVQFWRLQNQL